MKRLPKTLLVRSLLPLVLSLCVLVPPLHGAAPFLSEIMPANARILADEDGDFQDWLEIHNPGPGALNLQGWHLTDNPQVLTQWTFPSVSLPAGGYLVVFASGKNRTADPAHLHTSFQLDAGGEYLALVQPDGVTVASAFNPAFPAVKEDVAFGVAQSEVITSLLAGSIPRVLVPASAPDLPPNWRLLSYEPDARWSNGVAPPAVGFDTNEVSGPPVNVAPSGTAVQSTINGSFTPNLALNGNLGDFTHTLGTDTAPFWQVTLTNQMLVHSVVLFNRTSCCGSRLRDITIEILGTNGGVQVTNFTSALLNPENTGFAYPNGPAFLSNNIVALTGQPVLGNIVRVRRTTDPDLSGTGGQGNTDEASVLSLGEVVVNAGGVAGLRPYFTTDIQAAFWTTNASAFLRVPFVSSNAPDILTLRARYDDGFVAWLNGIEIARRNAPALPQWNSAATADRSLTNAVAQESIDVTAGAGALLTGTNILAVQLLNASAADPNALFQAELIATRLVVTSNVFFTDATPGSANSTPWYFDEVADTQFSEARGFKDAPFSLSITSATPGAVIYCSFNADEPGPGKGFIYTNAISITNTTVVRTRAFRENWKPTDVDTATYLFLADVPYQTPNWPQDRVPPRYFPASWGANSVDYGMDPNVVSLYSSNEWREALTQIPSLSIVTEMPNLFDPTTGIYANATGHGEEWERPMSLELLDPAAAVPGRFQENGGLRIRGGASRGASFYKHSFRLFFNRDYGAPSLKYPLFDDEGVDEFDKIDLRTSQNYSWPRNDSPTFDTMVREVFWRKTLGDMGQPYRRSRYYHLYLNGHYWGLYETDERPSAYYGNAYFGGEKDNYDVVRNHDRYSGIAFSTEATDGNLLAWSNLWVMTQMMRTNASNENYFRTLGRNADGTRNPALPVLIEADNLIDYMLGIFFSGDGDATLSAFLSNNQPNNWYGLRDRTNSNVGFRFFNNDCEHTLGSPSSQVNRTGPFPNSNEGNFTYSNPQWMHEALARNPEYRLRFADRVQKHFFNGGALTLEANTNRFIAKARQITKAIRAYSARWGDATSGANTTNYYGESHWTNAIAFCLNWFPARSGVVLGQLRAFSYGSLFPTVTAPSLNHYGGFVPAGFSLTLSQTNAGGTIYYTLDGTDPRLIGGDLSPTALTYTGPLTVQDNFALRTRVRSGTNWSAAVEAVYTTAQYFRDLAITEIHYNPPGLTNVDGDEFEFIELKNTGATQLDLSGLAFTGGIFHAFTNGSRIAPGAFLILSRNPAQLLARYPGLAIHGTYTGRLANDGETISLRHGSGGLILAVTYGDGPQWPQAADGHGFSLVPAGAVFNSDQPRHWRASSASGGSPGADDPAPTLPAVVINEALTHAAAGMDFIELHNPTGGTAAIGGWFLTDDPAVPRKFRIPDNTMLPAGQSVVFTEADFNSTPGLGNSFTLGAEGERVFLFSGNAQTNLTGYSHGFEFGAAAEGVTFGRHVISTGEDHFPAQIAATPGAANAGPLVSAVVIAEIHYNPHPGHDAFVELHNRSGGAVAFFDPARPTNTWRLSGVDYVFPPGVTLPAGGRALVVETEPAAFRARYGVPAEVPVFGPYAGTLQDGGESIELQRLDARGTNDNTAWVTLDAVRYNDRAPWPTTADGAGASLHRLDLAAYGNDPINWAAAAPTPGGAFAGGAPPVLTTQPSSQFVLATQPALFSVAASGPGPFSYQWRFNGTNLLNATNAMLSIASAQFADAGSYSVVVFSPAGSAQSTNAVLTVGIPASITEQPANAFVWVPPDLRATNRSATFRVLASSFNPPLSYQWRRNGQLLEAGPNVTGATSNTLSLTNVTLADGGDYDCAVTDALGTIYTATARLVPIITPRVIQTSATNATQVAGSSFTIGATILGSPPPFTFIWRSNSLVVRTNLTLLTNDFVVFRAPTNAVSFNYRLEVTNFSTTLYTTTNRIFYFTTVLADTDADGLPDAFEAGFPGGQLAPGDDLDGDGMTNLEEYIAGTDAADAQSYLRVDFVNPADPALLTFGAVSNRTYTVQYTANPDGGPWSNLAHIVATPTNRVETLADPGAVPPRYYRVVTPRQP